MCRFSGKLVTLNALRSRPWTLRKLKDAIVQSPMSNTASKRGSSRRKQTSTSKFKLQRIDILLGVTLFFKCSRGPTLPTITEVEGESDS